MKRTAEQPVLEWAELEGELVTLRPVNPLDATDAFPLIHRRREVLEWLIWQGPETVEELADAYRSWIRPSDVGVNYHLAIIDKASGRFAGTIGLRFVDHPFEGDLGYWLGEPYWGGGRMSEAVFLATYLGFRHLQATKMTAEVFLGNEGSARVLAKNGYERLPETHVLKLEGREDREEWTYVLSAPDFESFAGERAPLAQSVTIASK